MLTLMRRTTENILAHGEEGITEINKARISEYYEGLARAVGLSLEAYRRRFGVKTYQEWEAGE